MEKQVDFYILASQDPSESLEFASRLCLKVYQTGSGLCIWAQDSDQASQLDSLLWSITADSFIPHTISDDSQSHIWVGKHLSAQVLLNLDLSEPTGDWQRMLYLVPNNEPSLSKARDLFRYFKQQSINIKTHKMN